VEEFITLANEEELILIRNDILFEPYINSGNIQEVVFSTDGWHPNAKGYKIIAENIAKTIINEKILK
jgi:lysophospholipase L1-like esterase